MYISIKVSLVSGLYAYEDWSCEIELSQNTSLRELNEIILNAVGFDNDHFSQFFISRREFGSSRESFDDRTYSLDTELYGLFPLPKGKKLFYWFDFGDDWKFQVSKSRSKPKPFVDGAEYPKVVKEVGVKPEQYPESEW
ncbi:IS1096 element passenger TnpR family protein [Vibrio ouci]|uniref:Plasmid pRiA4b Orf3-like domain-containing protein n=1 Tax=Vibrio ouci TaxID=2499078 RepID=A0A4Y8W7J6_9VIBR|nr:hypothetical protein [Vibrio ouci]TFH88880.1 hypothetical protein ELS82_25475 [Vibrio ouci]